jgi:hypothetical protein
MDGEGALRTTVQGRGGRGRGGLTRCWPAPGGKDEHPEDDNAGADGGCWR